MKTPIFLVLGVVAASLSACTTIPSPPVVDTTLESIRSDPWAYDGKTVRVRGVFNECISFSCEFCPTFESQFEDRIKADGSWNYASACMGVSFGADEGENLKKIGGFRLSRTTAALADLREEEARFTTSTLVAAYSAHCSNVKDPNGDPDVIMFCTDRASELENARIEKVHIRRTGATGAITSYGNEAIEEADDAVGAALRAAFNDQVSELSDHRINFAFVEPHSPDAEDKTGKYASGGVCECYTDDCRADEWPKQIAGTWDFTPANPYWCKSASPDGDEWRFD